MLTGDVVGMTQKMKPTDLQQLRGCLEKIAVDAGGALLSIQPSQLVVETKKNAADPVTQVDREVQEFIHQRLASEYPHCAFVGEETWKTGTSVITSQPTFIVDPIDGTANFVHGLPDVCISIAFATEKIPMVGVVYNPFRSELWSAAKGHGAFLEVGGKRRELPFDMPAPPLRGLQSACIGLEWSSDRSGPNFELNTHVFTTLASDNVAEGGRCVHALRFHGSAAQTICRVAAGQQDAFWQCGCWAWDVAAAWCVLIEAGGIVVDGHPHGWDPPIDNRRYLAVRPAHPEEQKDFVKEFWAVIGSRRSTYGANIGTTLPSRSYPGGVPIKFSPQGVPALYEGNTTICHVPTTSPILSRLKHIYTALSTHPTLSPLMYFVPPSSWHMTILGGVREKIRSAGTWPVGKENMSLEDCTQEFSQKLRDLGHRLPDMGLGPPYRVRLSGFDADNDTGIGIRVTGATISEEGRLRRLRDLIADVLFGFRAADHESFILHITISYYLHHINGAARNELTRMLTLVLSDEAQGEFELGAIEFCRFKDMLSYERLFYLTETEARV